MVELRELSDPYSRCGYRRRVNPLHHATIPALCRDGRFVCHLARVIMPNIGVISFTLSFPAGPTSAGRHGNSNNR